MELFLWGDLSDTARPFAFTLLQRRTHPFPGLLRPLSHRSNPMNEVAASRCCLTRNLVVRGPAHWHSLTLWFRTEEYYEHAHVTSLRVVEQTS